MQIEQARSIVSKSLLPLSGIKAATAAAAAPVNAVHNFFALSACSVHNARHIGESMHLGRRRQLKESRQRFEYVITPRRASFNQASVPSSGTPAQHGVWGKAVAFLYTPAKRPEPLVVPVACRCCPSMACGATWPSRISIAAALFTAHWTPCSRCRWRLQRRLAKPCSSAQLGGPGLGLCGTTA
jgi:hypothetical protein